MSFKTYHVRERNVGQPLSAMLRSIYPDKSWNDVKKMVASRHVQIDGNLCVDDARRLKANEIIRIYQESLSKPADVEDVVIRYIDQHLLICEKPANVTTLRHHEEEHWDDKRKSKQHTLEELLQKAVDQRHKTSPIVPASQSAPPPTAHQHGIFPLNKYGKKPLPPIRQSRQKLQHHKQQPPARRGPSPQVRAVHRLDRDTSGLMIFALSQQAEPILVSMFSKHSIERTYMAVVHGHPHKQRIESNLTRDRGDGLRGSLLTGKQDSDSKNAITHVEPIRKIGPYTLIECRLETGRTHQIRIHLSEKGHMLCGERMYTRQIDGIITTDESGAPRHALHAYKLTFKHPITQQSLSFESAWPMDLLNWLKKLEKSV